MGRVTNSSFVIIASIAASSRREHGAERWRVAAHVWRFRLSMGTRGLRSGGRPPQVVGASIGRWMERIKLYPKDVLESWALCSRGSHLVPLGGGPQAKWLGFFEQNPRPSEKPQSPTQSPSLSGATMSSLRCASTISSRSSHASPPHLRTGNSRGRWGRKLEEIGGQQST